MERHIDGHQCGVSVCVIPLLALLAEALLLALLRTPAAATLCVCLDSGGSDMTHWGCSSGAVDPFESLEMRLKGHTIPARALLTSLRPACIVKPDS